MRFISRFTAAVCLLLFATVLVSFPLHAAEEHPEAAVQLDENLTLSALLETTLERHPDAGFCMPAGPQPRPKRNTAGT